MSSSPSIVDRSPFPKTRYDLCTGHYQCRQIDGLYSIEESNVSFAGNLTSSLFSSIRVDNFSKKFCSPIPSVLLQNAFGDQVIWTARPKLETYNILATLLYWKEEKGWNITPNFLFGKLGKKCDNFFDFCQVVLLWWRFLDLKETLRRLFRDHKHDFYNDFYSVNDGQAFGPKVVTENFRRNFWKVGPTLLDSNCLYGLVVR